MITFYLCLVFVCANALQVEVKGDITFDLNVDSEKGKAKEEMAKGTEVEEKAKNEEPGREMKANSERDVSGDYKEELVKERRERVKKDRLLMVTKATAVECVYQYPETSQLEAVLSNMMNQLAKVYVRVQDYVGAGARRGSARFLVVNSKKHTFFDEIYSNMTQEYRKLYNTTSWWVPRTSDPCEVQPELKTMWSHLIDSSTHFLRQAVESSVRSFLKNKVISVKKRSVVDELVEKELGRVRTSQLNTLCDNFQLCFDELVSQNDTNNDTQTLMPINTIQPAFYRY